MDRPREAPTLTDGTVTLRPLRDDDVPGIVEQCRDPLSQRWTTAPADYDEQAGRAFVREHAPRGWREGTEWIFAVEAERDGVAAYAGNIALRPAELGQAEVAYGAAPWARGRGLMERAVRLMLRWGFDEQGLAAIEWWATEGNWASRRLAWRLGFRIEGTVRRHLPHRGELVDAWVGTLLPGDDLAPAHPWQEVPVIEGDRVRLRPVRPDDDPRIVEACNDPGTSRWLGQLPAPYTREDAATWRHQVLTRAAEGTAVIWAVADAADDRMVGATNLFDLGSSGSAEVGYWTSPDARGKGLTVEATRLALRHGFLPTDVGGLGLDRIYAYAALGNTASRRVLAAAGLLEQGVARRTALTRAGLEDAAMSDLLREEWEATQVW